MPDLADTLFATKPLLDHYSEYQGDINTWYDKTFDEATRSRHDAFYGTSPDIRAASVNKTFIGDSLGVPQEEVYKNYDQYRSHFATKYLGLEPDANDEQIWGAISTHAKKRKEEFGLLDDAWDTGAKAAVENRYPFETWSEWSKGKKVGDREKSMLVRAWSEESKKLDKVRPDADRIISNMEKDMVTNELGDWKSEEEIKGFIDKFDDQDFNRVAQIVQNHKSTAAGGTGKELPERWAERIGRLWEKGIRGAGKVPLGVEFAITESALKDADHYFFDEDKFKKLTEAGDPFAFYEAFQLPMSATTGVKKPMDDATREKMQDQINRYGRYIDRVEKLRRIGQEKLDPTTSGVPWEDLTVDIAEVAGFTLPALLTGGAAAAAGFGTAARIAIAAQPLVGLFAEDKLTEMQFDPAYANVNYGSRVKLALAAAEFDSLVESVSDIAQFTRLGKLGNFVTKMKSPTARFLTRTGANVVMEVGEETIQQMSLPVGTEIAQWFDDNMPEVALKEKLGEFLTADNLGHLALVVLPYAIIGAGTKELGADLDKFNLYVEENKDDLQARYSSVEALSLVHDDKTAKEIAALAKVGTVESIGKAVLLSANSEMQARVPQSLQDTTPQVLSMKQKILDSGFAKTEKAEVQAAAYAQSLDSAVRAVAAKTGKTLDEVYSNIGFDADGQTGDLMQPSKLEDFSDPDTFYRVVVGDAAFQDIVDSGGVRTNAETKTAEGASLQDRLAARPTAFPSFSKGSASISYAKANPGHYIITSTDPSIQPSKQGRHGKGTTMFPTDSNGNPVRSLSGEKVNVYKHQGDGSYQLVYSKGAQVDGQTGDLMQGDTAAVDRAVAFREAINLDDAEARSTMLANLPSQVTLQQVTDPDLPDEPMYRALLGSPSEVTGQTDNDALLIGEFEEKPTLAQVQEMITDGMAEGLLTQADVAGMTMVEAGDELMQPSSGIDIVHYSRTPDFKPSSQFDTSTVSDRYEEESILGEGVYAALPADENLWKNEMSRFTLGKHRNALTIHPENPLYITPETANSLMAEDVMNAVENGTVDAVIISGFEDHTAAIYKREKELWSPVFEDPNAKSGRFINTKEYDAARRQATEEITGIKLENYESLNDADLLTNQVFIPQAKVDSVFAPKLEQGNKGSIQFLEDGKVLLKALEGADASTFIHELGHFVRRYALSDDHVQTIGDYYGVEDGDWAADYKMWKSRGDVGSSAEERFAKDFERYFYDGKLPENADSALVKAFKVLKELMHEVYKALKGSPIATSIDPDVRAAIDSVFEGKRLDVNSLPGMPASPAAMRTAEMADPVMEAPADGHLYSLVSEQEVDEDVLFQPDTGEKITEKQMFGDRESGVYHVVQANAELIAAVKPHFDAESLDLSDPTDQALAGMYFARGVELVDQNFNPDPDLDGAQQALHAEITEFARRMWSKMGDGAPYAWVMNNPAMQATKIARELQARSIYAKTTIDTTKEKIDENMVSMLDNLNPAAKKGKGGTGLKLKDLERIIDGIVPEASAEIATEIQQLVDERKKKTPKKGTAGKLADDEVKEKENREKLEAKIKKLTDKRVQAYIKKFSEAGSDPPLYEKAKKAKLEDELAALVRKQLSQYPLTRDEFLLRAAELDIEHADASELFNSSQDERDRQIRIKQYRDLLRREKATRDNNNATARRIIAAIAETQSDTQSWVDKRKPVNPVREAYKELLKPGPIRSKDAFIKLLPEADIELVSRLYDAAMLERRAAAEVKRVFTPGLLLKRSIPAIQKQLLANPLLSISSEEQRIKLATEYFVENGMARPDAERAAAMFIDEFTRNLGAARVANAEKFIKRNGPLERVLKQPTKNKKTYYDKLMETIRSGALDGRLRITEELAKENGWSGLNTEANEKLMILDEKLRDPDAGLHEKAELNMAVEEVVFNAGLPMSFLDMASPYYCLSIFSSFKTLTGLQLSPLPYTLLAATTRDLGIATLNGNLHGHMLAIKAYTHALIGPGFSEGLFALKTGKQVTADPDMRQSINRLQVAMDQNMAILKNPASNAWEKGKAFLKTLIASEKLFGNVMTAMDAWMTKSSRDYIATSQRSMALKNVGLPDGGAALQEIMEAVNHDRQGYERLAVTRFPSPTMDLSATGALEKADALWEFKKDLSANVQRRSIWVEDMLERDILSAIAGKGVSEEHIKEMETIAKNEAGMTTGIHDVEGFFKKPFDAMQSWMNTPGIEGLAWRATLAAVKTPGNIVNYGRNWLPGYAIFRAWRQNRADVGSKPFPVSYGTVAQQQMRMHETIWGTVMWATMIAMLKDNEDKEPKDQYFRMNSVGPPKGSAAYEVWKSEGRKPNTFQFRIGGDKWTTIGFRGGGLETISIALTPIAAYEQAKINNPEMLRNGEGLNVWAYAMTAFSELSSEQFFPLRGLLPLMGQSDSRRTSEENQQQRAARYAGYKLSSWLWGSSFMRSFNRFDDYKQSDTWQQAFIHSFPIPSLLAEGYALNGLGDHVGGGVEDAFDASAALGYPISITDEKPILSAADDPEKWVYVVNTRLLKGISKKSKQSWEKWVGREITPDEFAKLTTLRGKATKEAANRAFPDMKSLEAADMDAIEKLKDRYSKQVTDVVSRKFNSKTAASYLK